MRMTIRYDNGDPPVTLDLAYSDDTPPAGLTAREWALAAFVATNVPTTNVYGQPGARDVAAAICTREQTHPRVRPIGVGDSIITGSGPTVHCIAVDRRGVDAWGVATPSFRVEDDIPPPAPAAGPPMQVGPYRWPPDGVAYVEDSSDRLWTGRGAGEWHCMSDATGKYPRGSWEKVWIEHGPLTPLVPVEVEVVDDPVT